MKIKKKIQYQFNKIENTIIKQVIKKSIKNY